MGVWDVLKKIGGTIASGARLVALELYTSAALSSRRRVLKRVLLSRFTARQLDEIGVRLGIRLPRDKGEKIAVLAGRLSFEEVVALAKRYKVKHSDIVEELERYKRVLEARKARALSKTVAARLVEALERFRPEPVRDEEELEKQVYQYLKAQGFEVKRQAQVGPYRVDLLVDNGCGVEIKVPTSATHLQRLMGQVADYTRYLDCVVALVLDTGQADLTPYVEKLAENSIIPVIVEGELKKKTRRPTREKPARPSRRAKPRSRRRGGRARRR